MDDIKEDAAETETETESRVHNRKLLLAEVMEKTGLPRGKALAAVEAVFESTTNALKSGKEVRLIGFGNFVVTERKASKGRDPRTGQEIDIAESKSVRFRPGKQLREAITPAAA